MTIVTLTHVSTVTGTGGGCNVTVVVTMFVDISSVVGCGRSRGGVDYVYVRWEIVTTTVHPYSCLG